jgi:iron(III) transport system permease protein
MIYKSLSKRYDLTPTTLIFLLVLIAFFVLFLAYPIAYVFSQAFFINGRLSVNFFKIMFTSPLERQSIVNSVFLGFVVTLATTLLSLPLSYFLVRYSFRGRSLLQGLILVPMVMPPFVGAIGMKQFFARFGSVNLILMKLNIIEPQNAINWFGSGFWGVVLLEVLHLYPIMYLNIAAALANIDPSLEEAAESVGAGRFRLFRTVTLPLMLPGYFAGAIIVFIWAFTDLGTPLIFEFRKVIPMRIFEKVADINTNPMGFALVVLVILMTMVFFYLSKKFMGTKRYEMMSRGHADIKERPVGRIATFFIYVFILGVIGIAVLPHISVALLSVADRWSGSIIPGDFTSAQFGKIFSHKLTLPSIRNSMIYSSLSTILDLALGILIAYMLSRKRIPGKNILDATAMLPLALPGLVLAFGYVGCFSGTSFAITYGRLHVVLLAAIVALIYWAIRSRNREIPLLRNRKLVIAAGIFAIILLVKPLSGVNLILDPRENPVFLLVVIYAVRRLPYMVRAAYAGFQQTSIALEEASQSLGATPMKTMRKITFPLIIANLVAGGILSFAFAMLEVGSGLILAMKEQFYPITKAIYALYNRIEDGAYIASAMGILGMVLLIVSLILAGRFLGRRMGELFRA